MASVLDAQPGVDVRVLIIDDASPDGQRRRRDADRGSGPPGRRHRPRRPTRATSPRSTRDCSSGRTATTASCCRRTTAPRRERWGGRATCSTPTLRSGSCTDGRCGSRTAPAAACSHHGVAGGRLALAASGSSGASVRRRTRSPHQRSSSAPRCSSGSAATTRCCRKAADMEIYMRFAAHADVGVHPGRRPGLLPPPRHQHEHDGHSPRWTSPAPIGLRARPATLRGPARGRRPAVRRWSTGSWAARRCGLPGVSTTGDRLRRTEIGRRLLAGVGTTSRRRTSRSSLPSPGTAGPS